MLCDLVMDVIFVGVDHHELTDLAQQYFGNLGQNYDGGKIDSCKFTGGEVRWGGDSITALSIDSCASQISTSK